MISIFIELGARRAQRNDYGDFLFLIEYLLSISHSYSY